MIRIRVSLPSNFSYAILVVEGTYSILNYFKNKTKDPKILLNYFKNKSGPGDSFTLLQKPDTMGTENSFKGLRKQNKRNPEILSNYCKNKTKEVPQSCFHITSKTKKESPRSFKLFLIFRKSVLDINMYLDQHIIG